MLVPEANSEVCNGVNKVFFQPESRRFPLNHDDVGWLIIIPKKMTWFHHAPPFSVNSRIYIYIYIYYIRIVINYRIVIHSN